MTAPRIDFVSHLGRSHRARLSLSSALLFTFAVLLVGAVSWELAAIEVAHAAICSQLVALEHDKQIGAEKRAAKKPALGRDERVAINQAIRQLNLPWPEIFDTVERATSETIAVLSLTPDAAGETLTLVAESQTTDSMLAYVRALKAQPLFDDVSVVRHEINEKNQYKPIRFEVAAHWNTRK